MNSSNFKLPRPNKVVAEPLIWIVEDEEEVMLVYREIFEVRYRTIEIRSIAEFQKFLSLAERKRTDRPDMIISDLRLGDGNFFRAVRQGILKILDGVPLIIISSCDDLDVMREAFNEGSLDYLVKPFTRNELIAKVDRFLASEPPKASKDERLEFLPDTLQIRRGSSEAISLTPKEVKILSCLRQYSGVGLQKEELCKRVWGDTQVGEKTLEVHLANLRKKLLQFGCSIQFIHPNLYALSGDWMDRMDE